MILSDGIVELLPQGLLQETLNQHSEKPRENSRADVKIPLK